MHTFRSSLIVVDGLHGCAQSSHTSHGTHCGWRSKRRRRSSDVQKNTSRIDALFYFSF